MNWNGTNPRAARGSTGRPGPVTQTVLREYLVLAQQAKRFRLLRKQITEALEVGARVESGPLNATVTRRVCRRLTQGKLTAPIGEDLVQTFMENIELSESRTLDVREE